MEQKPLIGHLLEEIAAQPRFLELVEFMDKVIIRNKQKFISDFEKRILAEILVRMYSQGGEASLHDEYNRSVEHREIMNLILEDTDCIRTYNKIRGGHHYAQIPKIFTPLYTLDEPCEKQDHKRKPGLGGITWSSTDLLIAAISRQGRFLNLCNILSQIEEENASEMTKELLTQVVETLARAYRQGGELSLAAEVRARNVETMMIFRKTSECQVTDDRDRKDLFYQFPAIFSPHRIMGVPIKQETLTE